MAYIKDYLILFGKELTNDILELVKERGQF